MNNLLLPRTAPPLSRRGSLLLARRGNHSTATTTTATTTRGSLALVPKRVKIVEVGPRDGLQNEKGMVATSAKIELVNSLAETGLQAIEATAFVSGKWVPQMADNEFVMRGIKRKPNVSYPVLVPNLAGLEKALSCDVGEIAIFAAASEAFSKRNINCTIEESIRRFMPVVEEARKRNVAIRGYVSCVAGCPYEGPIDPKKVTEVTKRLLDLGCYEVSLGDTIGVGNPGIFRRLLDEVLAVVPSSKIAVHCHDTYGQALANILTSLEYGIAVVDSSVAGLGGCPYAQGATGNVATEDVLYMLHGMGVETGVDLDKIIDVGMAVSAMLVKNNQSRVATALYAKRRREKESGSSTAATTTGSNNGLTTTTTK